MTTQSAIATSLPLARSVISFSCSIRISSLVFAAALKVLRVQPRSRVSRTSSRTALDSSNKLASRS